jgi:toxin FitB
LYLIGTNVVSGLRRPRPHGAVVAWLASVADADLYLSAVTLAELQAGIELTREQDPAKAAALETWLEQIARSWNVLPMDGTAFRLRAKLMHRRADDLIEDAMIAATALSRGLTIATRKVRDFAPFGVPVLDPFVTRPAK